MSYKSIPRWKPLAKGTNIPSFLFCMGILQYHGNTSAGFRNEMRKLSAMPTELADLGPMDTGTLIENPSVMHVGVVLKVCLKHSLFKLLKPPAKSAHTLLLHDAELTPKAVVELVMLSMYGSGSGCQALKSLVEQT